MHILIILYLENSKKPLVDIFKRTGRQFKSYLFQKIHDVKSRDVYSYGSKRLSNELRLTGMINKFKRNTADLKTLVDTPTFFDEIMKSHPIRQTNGMNSFTTRLESTVERNMCREALKAYLDIILDIAEKTFNYFYNEDLSEAEKTAESAFFKSIEDDISKGRRVDINDRIGKRRMLIQKLPVENVDDLIKYGGKKKKVKKLKRKNEKKYIKTCNESG